MVKIKPATDQFKTELSDTKAALHVVNLRKRFGQLEVIKGLSLTANQGDVISILGSSGSGKSTLLRCLNFIEGLAAVPQSLGKRPSDCQNDFFRL